MPWQILIISLILVTTLISILEKFTLKKEHASQFLTSLHLLISILVILFILLNKVSFNNFKPIFWLIIILPTLSSSLATLFLTKALKHLDISQVLPMINLSTVITILGAFIIFKEKITFFQLLGILLIISGGYILEIKKIKEIFTPIKVLFSNLSLRPQKFLFGAIIFYALTSFLDKWALSKIPLVNYLLVIIIYSTIFYLCLTFILYQGFTDIKKGFKVGGWFILPIAFLTFIQLLLWFKSIVIVPLSILVPAFRLHTLIGALIGGKIFKEKNLTLRLIGAFLMIIGGFIVLQ